MRNMNKALSPPRQPTTPNIDDPHYRASYCLKNPTGQFISFRFLGSKESAGLEVLKLKVQRLNKGAK